MQASKALSKALSHTDADSGSQRDLDWMIVQKIQRGQVGAFDELVQKYRAPIFSVFSNLTSNRDDSSVFRQERNIKALQTT